MTPGDPKEKPVNWARLRQRYTSLMFRREPVLDGLVLSGIVVKARDPEELVIETERMIAERVLKEEPS